MGWLGPFLQRRRRRHLAAWLGLCAIALQAMLPVLQPPMPGHGMAGVAAGATVGTTVVICTPYGYKLVALADLPPGEGSSSPLPLKTHFCPLCQLAQSPAALPPPAPPVLVAPVAEVQRLAWAEPSARRNSPALANLQARAPPPIA